MRTTSFFPFFLSDNLEKQTNKNDSCTCVHVISSCHSPTRILLKRSREIDELLSIIAVKKIKSFSKLGFTRSRKPH